MSPLYGGRYGSNVYAGLDKSVRCMESPLQSVCFGEVLL